ncbi:MAG: SUMF1/EgtB/PvdO family nonheme iron enzyme [Lentisphaerae bacterium]|nr:SUMF1/EgtB/PvdO family nonheme iron enzyme [Lentisphaerota bacterium]
MAILLCVHSAVANNVAVSNVTMLSRGPGTAQAVFDITWENSWWDATNYDACWVFVKYSTNAGASWSHATLRASGTNPAGFSKGSITNIDIVVPADKKGGFIQRSANGSGTLASAAVEFTWDFIADGVATSATAQVRVFALEMVYVPTASFELGSGGNEVGHFYEYNQTTNTYTVSSTNAITTSTVNGNLWGIGGTTGDDAVSPADPNDIPAAFPKGYSAFYCMKYEISQRQYCDFLNTLTAAQQNNRHDAALHFNSSRNFIKKTGASPAFFGCDAGNDAGAATTADSAQMNETDDGEWVACNYLSWADGCAYADWAALRPMTELEREKACRGDQAPVPNEYAWGNTTLEAATSSVSNQNTAAEAPNQGNCNYSGCALSAGYRCGSYAKGASTRQNAGASYYGILELSGNQWEMAVTVGNAAGRTFTGLHGDGALSVNGYANVANWPTLTGGVIDNTNPSAAGAGFHGGGWSYASAYLRVSDRELSATTDGLRYNDLSFRCVRSAP